MLGLLLGAEPHHPLDAGAVVPTAVEDHDLAGGREVRQVALDVHLRLLALGRRRQRHDAEHARADPLGDRLDRAALAGGVPALEHDADLGPLCLTHSCSFTSSTCSFRISCSYSLRFIRSAAGTAPGSAPPSRASLCFPIDDRLQGCHDRLRVCGTNLTAAQGDARAGARTNRPWIQLLIPYGCSRQSTHVQYQGGTGDGVFGRAPRLPVDCQVASCQAHLGMTPAGNLGLLWA